MLSSRLHRFVPVLLAAGLIAGAARSASAQELEPPRRRQGYYISGGLGLGPVHNWVDGDGMSTRPGSKVAFRIGQLLTPRLGLGLLIESAATKKDKVTTSLGSLGFEGHVALVRNLALRGSAGLGVLQIVDDAVLDDKTKGTYGAQFGIGLAYDFFPFGRSDASGGFAITPTLDLRTLPGESAASVSGFVGVEFVWWTGLPRNQLQLPESEAYKK